MNEGTERTPEQRRANRFALMPPLVVDILEDSPPAIRAQLVNVSRFGTAILADVLLGDPGVTLVLGLPDRGAREPVPVACELRWALAEKDALPRRWLHGARLGRIEARAQRLIEDLVQDARGTRRRGTAPPAARRGGATGETIGDVEPDAGQAPPP